MSFRSSLSMNPSLLLSITLKAYDTRVQTRHELFPTRSRRSPPTQQSIVLEGWGAHLFKLLNLGLVKHGEDVGRGPLAALLPSLLALQSLATLREAQGGIS